MDAARDRALELRLKSVVIGSQACADVNCAAVGAKTWIQIVNPRQMLLAVQPPARGPNVRERDRLFVANRLLDARVPLESVGKLQMRRERIDVRGKRRRYRRGEIQLSRSRRQRSAAVERLRSKSESQKSCCSGLMIGVKEGAAAGAHHCFPSWTVANSPSQPEAGSKVIPTRVPQGCTPRSKRQGAGITNTAEQGESILPVRSMRRWIDLPPQTHREVQPGRNTPIILHKSSRFVENRRRR